MTPASWPGTARKPDKPPHEADALLAELMRNVGLEFAGFGLALAVLLALLALAGCAGGGPLGTGLGEVVANIAVDDGKGGKCTVAVTNGKDQTNLTLKGLHVCGGSLDELHADRSDGAAAAIAANAQVTTSLGGQLIGLLGSAVSMLAPVPVPHGPAPASKPVPPIVVVPPPPEPPPAMLKAPEL
jgi:predicted small lipoprotein YifL